MIYISIPAIHSEVPMTHPHVAALQARHHEIDDQIATEEKRPAPDTARLAELKRRKLKLKEEMAQG